MKIGLVGFSTDSGIGNQNRDIARWLPADAWLTCDHTGGYPHVPIPGGVAEYRDAEPFLSAVDVVLFVEQPRTTYPFLLRHARAIGKRVVCVPNHEWFPENRWREDWPQYVDLFVCPTRYTFDLFTEWGLPCRCFPWPVDTDRFAFTPRRTCERFVFVNGRGGTRDRKGLPVVAELVARWRGIPLTVFSQKPIDLPGVDVRGPVADPRELYAAGDVLLCPHSVDGIGLEPLEALACGMPVIATDGPPWTELPLLAGIPASIRQEQMPRRVVDWHLPVPAWLEHLCRQWHGRNIETESRNGHRCIEGRAWSTSYATFRQLVGGAV